MDQSIEQLLKDLALDQLIKTPIGNKLQQAIHIFQTAQNHYFAIAEKQDELGMTGIKVATTLTFSILKKIADGKVPSELNAQDWKEIAATVSQYALLNDDQQYSVFVFALYERYIRHSIMQIEEIISEETAEAIISLADQLHDKAVNLSERCISEEAYTEECLWISLEAMVKLLACTAIFFGDQRVADFAQALTFYAFEYGRLMLHKRELEIINQFVESQYQLNAELEQKYAEYLENLQRESHKFYTLIDNAFAPDFREAFLHSVILARAVGVNEKEILTSTEEIDAFFLE